VRFVFHYDISDSVDSYYQEIGRAGRDGNAARAILFYNPKDVGLQKFLSSSGRVEEGEVELVAKVILEHGEPVDPKELREELDISQAKLSQVISRLEEPGVVEILADGKVAPKRSAVDLDKTAEEVAHAHESLREYERSRVEMMRGYAELHDCRREYLLNYFGEEFQGPCGFCDNCDAGILVDENEEDMPFPINSRVVHKMWREGLVLRYEGDKMVVLFDEVGYKTLSVDVVTENHLLERA
jgi:ATP-dependent DNA helicase RecQ